MSKFDLIR